MMEGRMDKEHERAKNAYKRVETLTTVSTDMRGETMPEFSDLDPSVWESQGKLFCNALIKRDVFKEMKNLDSETTWHKVVNELEKEAGKAKKNLEGFKTFALKLPTMLLTCGLLQTLSFYHEKRNAGDAYGAIKEWLQMPGLHPWQLSGNQELPLMVACLERDTYRMMHREAIAYATWLKRAASAMIPN
jgi:CRISPR-associated protein Cmr5